MVSAAYAVFTAKAVSAVAAPTIGRVTDFVKVDPSFPILSNFALLNSLILSLVFPNSLFNLASSASVYWTLRLSFVKLLCTHVTNLYSFLSFF